MKKILLASTILFASFFTACSTVKVKSEDTSSLMKYDGTNTDYSKLDSYKKATICKEFVIGKGYVGSNSVAEAAKNGGISKVKHVDIHSEYTEQSGLFSPTRDNFKQCVTVYGE